MSMQMSGEKKMSMQMSGEKKMSMQMSGEKKMSMQMSGKNKIYKLKKICKVTRKIDRRTGRGEPQLLLYPFFAPALDGGSGVNATPRPLYPREREQVPIV